jgi:carnitine monooxygenase subunit
VDAQPRDLSIPAGWDRRGLPGWSYSSPELLELEKELLFRSCWQLAGHECELPESGDYLTLDVAGERALVVRGRDGALRAFHNVCRHRGSRVVADERGRCRGAIVCTFHGWAYNLDGTLRGPARPGSFPALDPAEWSLKPIELELWQGFLFVRF